VKPNKEFGFSPSGRDLRWRRPRPASHRQALVQMRRPIQCQGYLRRRPDEAIRKFSSYSIEYIKRSRISDRPTLYFFIVDFICKNYPEHLSGFASIWNGDPDLERDRIQVVEFFRFQKLPSEIAVHFTNAGFDTLETLCSLTSDSLDDIERFNQTRWLPGHKVRLQQTFSDIAGKVRAFRQEREKLMQIARVTTGHCDHPMIMTRTNLPGNSVPALSCGPNPLPRVRALPPPMSSTTVTPPPFQGVPMHGMQTMQSGPMISAPMSSLLGFTR